jgi:Skp family chaperone for outer membrane proteins
LKKLKLVFAGVLLAILLGCNNQPQKIEPPKFGVVDVAKVVQTSKGGQKANAVVESLIRSKQAELNQKGEDLKKMEQSLKAPGSKIKTDEYNKAAVEYQKQGAAAEAEVKKKATELRKTVFDQIHKVINTIGQDEKYVMIFTADNVPYFQPTTDITDKVIKKYDESAGAPSQAAPPAQKPEPPKK